MTEEEMNFDPSLKKKKKKKKTPFDLDAALDEDNDNAEKISESKESNNKEESVNKEQNDNKEEKENEEPSDDLDLENFGKKKKKKKKEPLNLEDLDNALPNDKQNADDDDLDLESFGKKKKKKKRAGGEIAVDDNKDEDKEAVVADDASDPQARDSETPWIDTDRDYTYDELLQRVFNIMRDKNPEMVAGEKKKFVMRPPQVVRVGTKKTAFVNFTEIAKMLHRQPKHLLAFLFAELGTVGAIDGNNQLIIKGRFQQKHIENVLRRYIKEYVTCHTCRSPDTILNKETRIFFLQCMTCHSRCSVQTIKTGFQAVTGKRSAKRAKQ